MTPYRGPEPFRLIDHAIFRAREEETRRLLQQVTIYRGILVYGGQGAGKSSWINAGVIPEAVARGFAVERVLVRAETGHEILLDRIPLDEAESRFLQPSLARQDEAGRVRISVAEFEKRVRAAAALAPDEGARRPPTRVLIFDQFEEIITNFGMAGEGADARRGIVDVLLRLFFDRTLSVKLLLVFREDYLAKVVDLLGRAPDLATQRYWLRPPEKSRAFEIIDGPFTAAGEKGAVPRERFTPELTRRIAAELEAQTGSDRLSLADLQIACLELWNSPDPDRRLNEVHLQGLIEAYLDRALNELAKKGLKEPAMALLSFMVTSQGTRNIISEQDAISRVQEGEPIDTGRLRKALAALEKARLVRRDVQDNASYFEIVSEYLAPWIAQRRREREIEIARRRADRQLQGRRTQFALVAAVIGAVLLGLLVYTYYYKARRDADRAEIERLQLGLSAAQVTVQANQEAAAHERERARDLAALLAQPSTRGQKRTAMFGSTILEMAIGLALMYLLFSLVCSVLNELLAAALNLRARQLHRGVARLLADPDLVDRVYAHPLITSLTIGERLPSYIPASTFAYALIDAVSPAEFKDLSAFRGRVLNLTNPQLTRVLSVLAGQAKDMDELVEKIEEWFNHSMSAVAGAYKMRTQFSILALAAVVTVGLNVDTLNVLNRVSSDAAVRASLVAQAQALAEAPAAAPASTGPQGTTGNTAAAQTAAARLDAIEQTVSRVQSLGLPIGWPSAVPYYKSLAGWIITILAVSLGAPFWFDLLNRFMVVRSTIKPGEKKGGDEGGD